MNQMTTFWENTLLEYKVINTELLTEGSPWERFV